MGVLAYETPVSRIYSSTNWEFSNKKGIKISFTGSNLLKTSESDYECMCISYGAEVEVLTGNVTFSSPSRYAFNCRGTLTVGAANIVLDECTFMRVDSGDYDDPTIKIDGATITCTKKAGTSVVFAAGGNPSEDAINFMNSSLRLGGFSTQGMHGIIRGYDTRAGFIATLPDACPSAGTYNYDVNSGTTPVLTYSGPGHLSAGDNNLYFVLPEGNYNVAMGGKTWVCTVEDNDNNVFVEAPEPCFGLLALLALCFLRRK